MDCHPQSCISYHLTRGPTLTSQNYDPILGIYVLVRTNQSHLAAFCINQKAIGCYDFVEMCHVEKKKQWNFKTSMLLRLCSAATLRYRLAPNYAQFKGVLRQVAAAAAMAAVRRRRHLLHTKCSRGTIKHSAALGSVKGEEDPIHLLFIALLLNRLIKNRFTFFFNLKKVCGLTSFFSCWCTFFSVYNLGI